MLPFFLSSRKEKKCIHQVTGHIANPTVCFNLPWQRYHLWQAAGMGVTTWLSWWQFIVLCCDPSGFCKRKSSEVNESMIGNIHIFVTSLKLRIFYQHLGCSFIFHLLFSCHWNGAGMEISTLAFPLWQLLTGTRAIYQELPQSHHEGSTSYQLFTQSYIWGLWHDCLWVLGIAWSCHWLGSHLSPIHCHLSKIVIWILSIIVSSDPVSNSSLFSKSMDV